jgi:hypothetical protein
MRRRANGSLLRMRDLRVRNNSEAFALTEVVV